MKSDFVEYKIGDLYDTASGLSKSSKEFGFGYPFLSFKTVFKNYFLPNELIELANTSIEERKKCSVKKGDIFLTRTSETSNELGMSSVALKDYPEATFNGFTKRLRQKKDSKVEVYPKYIGYYLRSKQFRLNINSMASLTTRASLNNDMINRLPILLPSVKQQKRIGDLLFLIDEKIEINNLINKNLLAQKDSLYKNWFIDFAPFGKQKPANWENKAFKDILISRTEKSSDITLSMFSVTDNGIFPRDEKFNKKLSTSSTKNKVIYKNDLVFGMSREILNWGIMKEAKGAVSSAYNVFKVATDINIKYLEGFIKYHPKYFHDIIKPASREGQGIDKNALFGKEIYLPTTKVLGDFYSIDDTLSFTIDNNIAENIRLSNIRDAVLPKLMSGEIDVSEIDI